MIIEACSVDRILSAPEFPGLVEEYARESANDGLPPPQVKIAMYRMYADAGILHVFTAQHGGEIVGFITVVATINPHYGVPLAVSESFFVSASHRKGGTWRKLLQAAEWRARLLGAAGLYVSAPVESALADVLPMVGYRATNIAYFKRLCDA
jgi:GNAT superfamily N-acetyltransferase